MVSLLRDTYCAKLIFQNFTQTFVSYMPSDRILSIGTDPAMCDIVANSAFIFSIGKYSPSVLMMCSAYPMF